MLSLCRVIFSHHISDFVCPWQRTGIQLVYIYIPDMPAPTMMTLGPLPAAAREACCAASSTSADMAVTNESFISICLSSPLV